jgi:hypothetical protein
MRRRSAGRGSAKGLWDTWLADVRAAWRRHGDEVVGQAEVRQSIWLADLSGARGARGRLPLLTTTVLAILL